MKLMVNIQYVDIELLEVMKQFITGTKVIGSNVQFEVYRLVTVYPATR
ncbi:hypothetical protein [Candidatus Pseudomonas adelgestsugas]|nr:hypothetical protein [Candidatus Pseudomonas adelgestsugas]